MNRFLVFGGGFIAGIAATFFTLYVITLANKPNDGLVGLAIFSEEGECITSTSKSKSREVEVFQVIAPNAALAHIKYYTDKRVFGDEMFRDYDIGSDVVVLLVNYDGNTYYDNQKIDISDNCARQIGTYQYETKRKFQKTVPAVVIE